MRHVCDRVLYDCSGLSLSVRQSTACCIKCVCDHVLYGCGGLSLCQFVKVLLVA